jgi:hypothetical protein
MAIAIVMSMLVMVKQITNLSLIGLVDTAKDGTLTMNVGIKMVLYARTVIVIVTIPLNLNNKHMILMTNLRNMYIRQNMKLSYLCIKAVNPNLNLTVIVYQLSLLLTVLTLLSVMSYGTLSQGPVHMLQTI